MHTLLRKIVIGLVVLLLPGVASAAQQLPNSRQVFFDTNGNPLSGGTVTFYVPGTTTPKNTWSDAAETVLNPNPLTLDAAGRATIYGNGSYRQIVKDSLGNTIWDAVTATPDVTPPDGSITTAKIADNAITTAKIPDGAVTAPKIPDGVITGAKIAANTIAPADIALGAWTDVASAATVNLGAQPSRNINITGTTTITSFGATATNDNIPYNVRFSGALTLTYNATSLIVPSAANITTAAGDTAQVVWEGGASNTWRVISYTRANGQGIVPIDWKLVSSWTYSSAVTNVSFTNLEKYDELLITLEDVYPASPNATLRLTLSDDNGVNYSNSGYTFMNLGTNYNSGGTDSLSGSSSSPSLAGPSYILLSSLVSDSSSRIFGEIRLTLSNDPAYRTRVLSHLANASNTNATMGQFVTVGMGPAARIDNAVRLAWSLSGNFAGGTIRVFGR
jgi:hypothetical protein